MGQQQLLLVILVTIIVGVATVVAINTFGSAQSNANVDAVRNDVAQIASNAQGSYIKPTQLGGAGKNWSNVTFNGMAFPADHISDDGRTAANQNGTYELTGTTELTITAYPSSDPAYDGGPDENDDIQPGTSGGSMVYTVTQNEFDLTTDYEEGGE